MHASRNFINFVQKLTTMTWNGKLRIYLNFNYRSTCRNGKVWWVGDSTEYERKLTFVFVYFEVGISSTYIPISTNNILQEILVWVLKWNRLGFFYCFEATQNSIYLLTKKTIWNTTQIFITSFLFYNLHSMYIRFSFFINQFWLYNKTRKKEQKCFAT